MMEMEKQQTKQTFPAGVDPDKMGTAAGNVTPDDNIAIRVNHVSKYFKLPTEPTNSLRRAVVNRFKGIKGYRRQEVLKDISFDIEKGDFFGIVGRNGSGKSTLLKIISKIYKPNSGSVEINGRLVSFIELGVGFNDELSGRENVYLNGAMLGFSSSEIDEMYDEIVEFSELQDFMDQKLKNYSSGMQVRLAFSVAIMAKGDILVLDEVLAVGDEAFQRKCNEFFYSTKRSGKTIVLVTHSMEAVRQFCNKALMIQDGEIVAYGNPDKVASSYSQLFKDEYIEQVLENERAELEMKSPEGIAMENEVVNAEAMENEIVDVRVRKLSDLTLEDFFVSQNGKKTRIVNFKESFKIDISFNSPKALQNLNMGVHLINQSGQDLMALSTKSLSRYDIHAGLNNIVFTVENIFTEGTYYFNFALEEKESKKLLIQEAELYQFSIFGLDEEKYSKYGLTYPKAEIEIIN
ncbi:hypothetical protein OfM2_15440 [Lactovum odontotermitis]